MNSHLVDPRHPWTRLTAAARTVGDDREASAPFGFATRVASLALGREIRAVSLFDVFALRALAIAVLLAAGSVAFNFGEVSRRVAVSPGAGMVTDDVLLPVKDAVTVVLALAD